MFTDKIYTNILTALSGLCNTLMILNSILIILCVFLVVNQRASQGEGDQSLPNKSNESNNHSVDTGNSQFTM